MSTYTMRSKEQFIGQEHFLAPRGESFKNMIINILKTRSKLKDKYIEKITDDEGMKLYECAFTHPSIDEKNNYEFYELLGDSTVNKSIVWYLMRRFPHLHNPQGVCIVARLKICLVSKKTLSSLCEQLHVWDFISCDAETRNTKMKKTLEDVFESFMGVTEYLIDYKILQGTGYSFCYNMISSLFNEIVISLKYEDLYDAKTRLKELMDFYKNKIVYDLKYVSTKTDMFFVTEVYCTIETNGKRKISLLGTGKACLKQESEQKGSEEALEYLKKIGFSKPVPDIYNVNMREDYERIDYVNK